MSAFLVPEQFSKLKGGEGEAGEGVMLPWSKGEGPAQGHGVRRGGCWGGRRAPFDIPLCRTTAPHCSSFNCIHAASLAAQALCP